MGAMSWGARMKAALSGDVSGVDVAAMLAAAGSLSALGQELADRRLAAELDHAGHEWRVCMALAPIAAPLWLGEALVTFAGSLVEAEAAAHPDRPSDLSPVAYALAVAALRPVTAIVAEVSATLVDPSRPSSLTAPLTVGPRGAVAAYPLPIPVPAPYPRGLLHAAALIQGAAQAALNDAEALVGRSPAPGWLTAALRRVGGELRAAQARLDMAEVRLGALLRASRADEEALLALCADLWDALNTGLVIGQMVREPHLLPGAPTAAPAVEPRAVTHPAMSFPPSASPAPPASPPDARQGVRPPVAAPERPLTLPEVGDGVRDVPRDAPAPAAGEIAGAGADPAATRQGQGRDAPLTLPRIGAPDPLPAPRPDALVRPAHPANPAHPAPSANPDVSDYFRLPRIGPDE